MLFFFLFLFFSLLFCYLVPGPCDPEDLLDGVVFGAKYLGSTQLKSEKNPSTNARMTQAQEAVDRIKVETADMSSHGFHTVIMPKIMWGMLMMWSDVLVTDFSSRLQRESLSQWPKWICSSQRSELKCSVPTHRSVWLPARKTCLSLFPAFRLLKLQRKITIPWATKWTEVENADRFLEQPMLFESCVFWKKDTSVYSGLDSSRLHSKLSKLLHEDQV